MPKPRKSSKHSSVPQAQPGPWSEWTLSPPESQGAGQYYRARKQITGKSGLHPKIPRSLTLNGFAGGWEYEYSSDPYGASNPENDYTPYESLEESYSKPHEIPRDPEEELANSLNTLDLDGVGNDDPEPLSCEPRLLRAGNAWALMAL